MTLVIWESLGVFKGTVLQIAEGISYVQSLLGSDGIAAAMLAFLQHSDFHG